jgi:Rrf2 family iron-sulfur cluster assembly transcriptional regulator
MRLALSTRTGLALRALRILDGRTSPTSRSDLADALATTSAYLPQVLAPLVEAGWVESKPGPNGGYLPGRDARGLSICHLIETMEGPIVDGECIFRDGRCEEADPCVMHVPWSRARAALMTELEASPAIE